MTSNAAAGLLALYGVVALIGGVIGYLTKDSMPSLLAGGASGVVLLVSSFLTRRKPTVGLLLGGLVTLALLGHFGRLLVKAISEGTQPLPLVAIIMTTGGLVVLLAVLIALGKAGAFKGRS